MYKCVLHQSNFCLIGHMRSRSSKTFWLDRCLKVLCTMQSKDLNAKPTGFVQKPSKCKGSLGDSIWIALQVKMVAINVLHYVTDAPVIVGRHSCSPNCLWQAYNFVSHYLEAMLLLKYSCKVSRFIKVKELQFAAVNISCFQGWSLGLLSIQPKSKTLRRYCMAMVQEKLCVKLAGMCVLCCDPTMTAWIVARGRRERGEGLACISISSNDLTDLLSNHTR